MKKKVLYIITKSNWGGAQRYVYTLATSLPENRFDVVVVLGGMGHKGDASGTLAAELGKKNIRTIFIRSFTRDIYLGKDIGAFFELLSVLRRERPDVVHLNSSKAGGLGALAARIVGIPQIVFTSHGLAWDEDRTPVARLLIYLATRVTFFLCTAIITISKDNYERVRHDPSCARKVHLIYNGLMPLSLEGREAARRYLESRLSFPLSEESICIGTIAELTKNKGLTYLIRAAAILSERQLPYTLLIIGSGEEEERLRVLLEEEGLSPRVHLLGFIPEAYRYLQALDIFALTSVKEGLPYVLLEAGAASVATVASRIPGVTDIITDRVDGLLTEAQNPEDIATQLEALIIDTKKRKTYGDALHENVGKRFSLTQMIEQTTALY